MRDYLKQNTTPTLNGTITYLSKKLTMVRTDTGIEGRLDLNGLYFYDKQSNTLRHRHNNYRLTIGNAVELIPKKEDTELIFALKK